jgi:hypothetical protein
MDAKPGPALLNGRGRWVKARICWKSEGGKIGLMG